MVCSATIALYLLRRAKSALYSKVERAGGRPDAPARRAEMRTSSRQLSGAESGGVASSAGPNRLGKPFRPDVATHRDDQQVRPVPRHVRNGALWRGVALANDRKVPDIVR